MEVVSKDKEHPFPVLYVVFLVLVIICIGIGISGTVVSYHKTDKTWFSVLLTLMVVSIFSFVGPILWVGASVVVLLFC